MTINTENFIDSIMESFDRIGHIRPEDIPEIDLYMDQVTTFMDQRLRNTTRNPENDKILTKTMINNYAKNDLLPPPVKKKYSKEHVLLLIFIYYYKSVLSITDIQTLLGPITEQYFGTKEKLDLEEVYKEVFRLQDVQVEELKADVRKKFQDSEGTFAGASKKQQEFLQKFAFICYLSFDVYMKKLLIEKVIDSLSTEKAGNGKTKKKSEQDRTGDAKR